MKYVQKITLCITSSQLLDIHSWLLQNSGAVVQRWSVKKVFLKLLQLKETSVAEPLFPRLLTQVFWYFLLSQEGYSCVIIPIMKTYLLFDFNTFLQFASIKKSLFSIVIDLLLFLTAKLWFSELFDLFVHFLVSLPMDCYGPRFLGSYAMLGWSLTHRRMKFW